MLIQGGILGEKSTLLRLMEFRGEIASAVLWTIIICFVALYILEDIRNWKSKKRDKLLGPKALLCMLLTFGIQFLVIGLAVFIATQVEEQTQDLARIGQALIFGGLLSLVVPGVLYWKFIRPRSEPDIFRKALGINASIFGLFSGMWITTSVMNWLYGEALTTPLTFAALYTALLIGTALLLLIPLGKIVDREVEAVKAPEYTSFDDPTTPI